MQKFTGLDYLKIDIAGSFGLDKLDWEKRLDWFNSQEDISSLITEAEKPAMFFAGIEAFNKAKQGKPSGYGVSFDATSSGLQLLACLVNCEQSALLCNVVDAGHRVDAYTSIYEAMCHEINEVTKIGRADVKQAIMTALYTSTATPKLVFGTGDLLQVFYDKMETMIPGAWELNLTLQDLWQPYADYHSWIMPDNFHVYIPVMTSEVQSVNWLNEPVDVYLKANKGTKKGRSISPNLIHSIDGMIVREILARCNFKKETITKVINSLDSIEKGKNRDSDKMVQTLWSHYKKSGFLSVRIINYLDKQNMGLVDPYEIAKLLKSMPEQPFQIMAIHDCFRCLPNYGNDLRIQYNIILSQIASSNLLSFIASQITGSFCPVNKFGDISDKILKANYSLS